MKLTLVENWKHALKFWSVIFSSLGAAIMGVFTVWPDTAFTVWQAMPAEVRSAIPQNFVSLIGLFLFSMTALARIVKQQKLESRTLIVDSLTKEDLINGGKLKQAVKDAEL